MTEHPHPKKENLNTDLIFFTKNSKWILDLNIKCKTINPLKDNIGENLDDHWYGNIFYIYHQRYDL